MGKFLEILTKIRIIKITETHSQHIFDYHKYKKANQLPKGFGIIDPYMPRPLLISGLGGKFEGGYPYTNYKNKGDWSDDQR